MKDIQKIDDESLYEFYMRLKDSCENLDTTISEIQQVKDSLSSSIGDSFYDKLSLKIDDEVNILTTMSDNLNDLYNYIGKNHKKRLIERKELIDKLNKIE